jgi:Flp pilus assembly protein TadB
VTDRSPKERKKGLFALISEIPALITTLIQGEIELLKKEVTTKLKQAGTGAALLAGAGFFAFFALCLLLAAAVAAIAAAGLPVWASALIIAGGLLLIAGILVALGVSLLRRGVPPTPDETIISVKKDVRAIKGTGK